ncbi:aminotransferase class V-fold PLP-dependent enzyme [Lacipirellula limnantheis]|uniref:Cysteine desulfurase n=1 Tax=Lacipirellula limnantheis TaxID=2528024 RepID=A0A517U2R2_9BACT|nr:aminotransferase class V-fold PLP-dependent enzyme [Lacipirellula limnantheis]QDT74918.1 Cysteine desulfurase [Lacipirellula limnantheis]
MDGNIAETRQRLRDAMPVARRWAYFDHAAVAPVSGPAAAAMQRWVDESVSEGDTMWPEWGRQLKSMRQSAANLIGAATDEIALVPNTTAGINLVAEGLDWRSGDNLVTLGDEYPSNLYPWMHLADRGVETRRVPTADGVVDYDQLADRSDDRTRLITVSWVAFSNGCRRNLDAIAEIAQRKGALLFVDAIQGLGVFPLDVSRTPIDFLAADGHKWLLGPEGAGIAYIRRDRLPLLRATAVGAHSVVHAYDYTHIELKLKQDAARYEGGSLNVPGMFGLGASIDLLQSLGVENVAAAILDATDSICSKLREGGFRVVSPRDGEQRSGIVSFEFPGADLLAVRRHCLEQGVALACRAGRIRVSAHAYNTGEDIDRLMSSLATFTE